MNTPKTPYEQIVNIANIGKHIPNDMNAIFAKAEKESFEPAINDSPRRLLLAIDVQNDFIEGGSLAVPNSIGDVERITRFIYNNMEGISKIICSMDTHSPYQIFNPCWWLNPAGEHPDPYTIITHNDVVENRWRPLIKPVESLNYLNELEKSGFGKKQLCIWPYHCIMATEGYLLENEFSKMVHFHSVARRSYNLIIPKGNDPLSEMYGIIKPEYSEKGFINMHVLSAIEGYDEIFIVGEAASHCLMESVKQIAEHFANRPEITSKITILEDCTSPIAGFEAETTATFDKFKKQYGIKFAKSTDIQL